MPLYTKFFKDVLTKKWSIGGDGLVALRGQCSAVLLNPMLEKLQDPGSFYIPCMVDNVSIKKALCDLGASASILPLPIVRKVGLHDMIPTSMTVQLADRLVQRPMGVIEDVPVKVCNFYIPADFVVLNIPEDQQIPIILGRPFLAIGDVNISVKERKLTFKVRGNVVEFSLTGAISQRMFESVYSIDMLEEAIKDAKDKCPGEHLEEDYEALPPILDEDEGKNPPKSFCRLKQALISPPIVQPPNWDLPFELMCDASDFSLGAVLGQRQDKKLHVIAYISKTLDNTQCNYTTTEKEMLAVVYAFEKFRPYLLCSKVIVYTDHTAIKQLTVKKDAKPRLIC
ncbi:uncharacterized protein LOC141631728 [Silene latifolia]|uniref:uncharacterized protein LOC141631728 n=1 Tax=Silene latifolia TaxID=37657 RepID=UPI003D78AAA3